MPQNVLVSVLGEGEYLQKLIRAILEKEVVPQRNLFLSAKNAAACKAAEGYDEVRICEDELAAMIKSEIVLLTASKREMPTELAKISSSSQKRVVVSVCDSEKVDLAYLTDRIAAATELIAAVLHRDEEGKLYATYEINKKARPFLRQPCKDMVDAMCEMINEEGYIAPYYSGDGIIMMDPDEGNTDIKYFVPKEGTNRFVDAVCVTTASAHKTEAEKYINFLCRTEVAKANAEAIGYSTPHTEARKLLDPEVGENPIFYPSEDILNNTEVFDTLPDNINELQDSLWIKLKSN